MSWRGRDVRGSRWNEHDTRWGGDRNNRDNRENRGRSPVWELRRSNSPDRRLHRDRYDRDRDRHRDDDRDRRDDDRDRRDRFDRDSDRHRRDRHDRSREGERDRRRSPRRDDKEKVKDIPAPPTPPTISGENDKKSDTHSGKSSRSHSRERQEDYDKYDKDNDQFAISTSPGAWICKCGLYNFRRRQFCYRRNCQGMRSEGVVFTGDVDKNSPPTFNAASGITKHLLFKRLDALTTEEKILDAIKKRCSKVVLDSIAGITIGRKTLTGASKCLAYINFNSIADSTAAYSELLALQPPLEIDGREIIITFYNEPKQTQKQSNVDYNTVYYAQMANYSASTQNMSEADRVNAAAAVAQSAISAAQARNMSWTPVAVPTFVVSTAQPPAAANIPTGDGKTQFSAPDVRTFLYDETSGYYYDPNTGLYYDGTTQYFFNSTINQYMYWDSTTSTYVAASQAQQNTDQAKLPSPPQATSDNTIAKDPPEEKKKKEKDEKVKVAKKIAKDMERWARTLNQKKENARSNIVIEQPLDTSASKGSADIGFSVLGAGPSLTHVRELSPPPANTDEFLVKKVAEPVEAETDEGIIDWAKLTCLICKRRFPSPDVLIKHKSLSDLHKQNLAEYRKKNEFLPQTNCYRDRAAERRMKFGEDEPPIRKRYEPPETVRAPVQSGPPPNVVDTIGGKMLQKMGWSEGRGLGKEEQGRIAPIEAEQRPSLAGLGQKRGIYTPTPGETYRDTVKKLMIARYKEVVGQEEGI